MLDDIVPLRALAASRRGCDAAIPAGDRRSGCNEPAFTGTPMPKDEPLAPNPPLGAMIDYASPALAADPVEIAIYAPDGSW